MSDVLHIVCPDCASVNRIPSQKLDAAPKCGRCKAGLFGGKPVELTATSFNKFVQRNDIPLVIDCWASWCGPCRAMAPAFEQAASKMAPKVRFAKLNTETEAGLGTSLGIRSIPTLLLFINGKEVARQAGAMSTAGIVSWVSSQI